MKRLLGLAFLVAACGDDGSRDATPPPAVPSIATRSEAPGGPLPPVARSSRVVLIVAVDGLRSDHLDLFGHPHATTPNLSALADRSVIVREAYATSLAGGSALASLLVGSTALDHRVGSLREPGAAILPEARVTLAERFQDAGWRTLASVALPQLAPELCGLDQGFATWRAPDWSEGDARSALQVYHHLESDLAAALAADEPVLALLHFADPRAQRPAQGPLGAAFLEAHLAQWSERQVAVRDALLQVDDDPEAAQESLRTALGRGRGSPLYRDWKKALYDGHLAVFDAFLGEALELLAEHGRMEEATIIVTGLRGNALGERPRDGAPAFRDEEVAVPLILHFAGGARAGVLPTVAQPSDVGPTLLELVLGEEASPTGVGTGTSLLARIEGRSDEAGQAWITAPDLGYVSLRGPELGIESATPLGLRWVRDGNFLNESPEGTEAERLRDLWSRLEPAAQVELAYTPMGTETLNVDWNMLEGYCAERRLVGGAEEVRRGAGAQVAGRVHLLGESPALGCITSRRDLPMQVELAGEGLDESRVLLGERPLSNSLMPRLQDPAGPDWPAESEEVPVAELSHRGDVWWRLAVGEVAAGREVEALIALHPPEQLDDRLEWSAGTEVEVEYLPGRLDALRVRCSGPFELDIKKSTQRDLSLAMTFDGVAPAPESIRYRGRRFARPGVVRLYLPDWMDGVTDDLHASVDQELATGHVRILRRDWSLAPGTRRGLPPEQLGFVRRLGGAE